jgi:two-component system phosphate regulon sensor histidine kinase PhoR
MWPALIFLALVALVLLDSWRRERRTRREQERKFQDYAATALYEQKQAAAQARAQQQALFDSMIEGVAVLDAGGRIQLINRSLERQFGVTASLGGRTLAEAFRVPALSELAERLRRERAVMDFELELSSAEPRVLQVNAAVIQDAEGASHGAILVFHDLTRLKQLERVRQEFVANVSHELRTPLSMIKGYVETLLDGAKDDPAQAARFLQTIDKHADRLTYLIEDLLTISRLESGQVVMNLHPVEVRSVAERVREDLQAVAAERNVAVETLLPAELRANADADRLQQVLFNLVENAIKYGKLNGRVIIGGEAQVNGKIQIHVCDDGPGIPAEAKERVFERFFRADKARSRETGGTGLGLAIVKHIVQAHGGEVWVESDPGKGATFFFTLAVA